MRKSLSSRPFIVSLTVLLLSAMIAGYFLVGNSPSTNSNNSGPKVIQVETIFGYIGAESNYSRFNGLIGMFDSSKYLVKNEDGLEPSLIVFAPTNAAFTTEELKPFESLNLAAKDQIKLYHMATIYPETLESTPNLELTDGKKIKTLSGRELIVSTKNGIIKLIDGKGRESTVSTDYAVSSKGDRIYFLDNVLLFQ